MESPQGGIFSFFMALMKAKEQNNFNDLPAIKVHLKTKRALRNLEDLDFQDVLVVDVNCNLKSGTSHSDIACGLDCSGNSGNADKVGRTEIDEDALIIGLPEPAYIDLKTLTKDYSNPNNLKAINTMPKITIKEDGIDETGCEEFGNYTIK